MEYELEVRLVTSLDAAGETPKRAGDAARARCIPSRRCQGAQAAGSLPAPPGGLCRGRFTQPAPAPGPVLLCRRYGNDWTAVRVSVPEYTPACCPAGMASSRLALRLLVPVPEPACA